MNEALTTDRRLSVTTDGMALDPAIAKMLTHAVVRATLGVPAVAELTFAELAEDSEQTFRVGAEVRLDAGSKALFRGTIAAVELEHGSDGGGMLHVRAYDALEGLRQRSRLRRIDNTSADAFAQELANEVGISFAAERRGASLPAVLQRGESDLEMLVDLAARDGLYVTADGDTLRLVGLEGRGDPIELRLGDTLFDARLSLSSERSVGKTNVEAWNPATLQAHRASSSRTAADGAAETMIVDRIVDDPAESNGLGDGRIARGEAFERVAEGTCRGMPEMTPGRTIDLSGVGRSFAGRYVVTTVTHRFDATGYRTEFSTRPPPPPPTRHETVVTLGRVTSVADPDNRGRCKVSLPGYADVEAGWLQCVVPAAGRRKGATFLPEPDEDVLVVFPGGDLAHGFVLGGLYGTRTLPPGVKNKPDRSFVLRTGNGQSLELSGSSSMARLSTRAGSLLEFAGNRSRLASVTDLVIEAPGKRIVIRAGAIDFERG